MSRRNIAKKRYTKKDTKYDSTLVSLFIARILKNGKMTLANSIVLDTFDDIKIQTSKNPIQVFESSIKNVSPLVEVKARRIGGSTYQVPLEVNQYRGTTLALKWIISAAKARAGRTIAERLANEIIDASNGVGSAMKKRQETHRMAEANKAFAHLRY